MSNDHQTNPWDDHIDAYERVAAPCTGHLAQSLFLSAAGRLPKGARILDVACGPGDLARAALLHCRQQARESGQSGSVTAADFSPAMVARTRDRLCVIDAGGWAHCEVQDGQALTYETASFDAVFSAFGIFLFPDRRAGWREAARVLRPGGLFATAVWRGPEHNDLARVPWEPVMTTLPERLIAEVGAPPWADIMTEEGLVAEICAEGFAEPEVTVNNAVLTAPTPRAMWHMMCDNPLAKPLMQKCTADELTVVERAVLDSFEALAGGPDRPVRFDTSCHFFIARRR